MRDEARDLFGFAYQIFLLPAIAQASLVVAARRRSQEVRFALERNQSDYLVFWFWHLTFAIGVVMRAIQTLGGA
jgi:hypothetical protein